MKHIKKFESLSIDKNELINWYSNYYNVDFGLAEMSLTEFFNKHNYIEPISNNIGPGWIKDFYSTHPNMNGMIAITIS